MRIALALRERCEKEVGAITKCNCSHWADFAGKKDMAVTFVCPEHGSLTFDRRRIPAPQSINYPRVRSPMGCASPNLPSPEAYTNAGANRG